MADGAGMNAEELYVRWRGRLMAYFAKRVAYAEAEDLTQELFVRYLHALANGTQIVQPRRWLWRAAHNLANDAYRRRARTVRCVPEPALEEGVADLLAPDPLELALEWDDRTDVARMLVALTPEQLEAVVLRYRYGWPHRRVAEAIGIAPGAAQARHWRAVSRLREWMGEVG